MRRQRVLTGVWTVLAVGVLAGCGGAASAGGTGAGAAGPTPAATSTATGMTTGHEHMIMIKDFAYTAPRSVAPGATVEVMNTDGERHTVTADDGGFDVAVPAGSTATFTAPSTPGTYAFHCALHSNMHGVLTVR